MKKDLSIKQVPNTTHSFYVDDILAVGIYQLNNQEVVLIDSSIDDTKAKSIDQALEALSLKPIAIINTHSHADHCGGNQYFQCKYPEIEIYATEYEKFYITDPKREPQCFCAGAEPIAELRNKMLEAKPSRVTHEITLNETGQTTISIQDQVFKIIGLPGHTPGMIGVVTPENILYLGDALFGKETLEKHGVLFYLSINQTFDTFSKLRNEEFAGYVLYHGLYYEDINELLEDHHSKLLACAEFILNLITNGVDSKEQLVQQVNIRYAIRNSITQYALTSACIEAYLQYLQSTHAIKFQATDDSITILPTLSTLIGLKKYDLDPHEPIVVLHTALKTFKSIQDEKIESALRNWAEKVLLNTSIELSIQAIIIDRATTQVKMVFDKPLTNKNGLKHIKGNLALEFK